MIFTEAIVFSKIFSPYHPKIFKGFDEWSIYSTDSKDYVVLIDLSLADESCHNQLENYLKNHNLKIECIKNYLIVSTS